MTIEDVVKQALKQRGMAIPTEVTDETGAHDSNEPITEDELLIQDCISRCIMELIQNDQVKFRAMSTIRRVFQRVLYHLIKSKEACSISFLRRNIDPRYRHFVPMVLQKCVQEGIVTTYDSTSGKMMFTVSHDNITHVVEYLARERAIDLVEYQKSRVK